MSGPQRGILALVIIVMFFALGARVAPQGVAPPPSPSVNRWVSVASWTGSGIKGTENFTVTGDQWRINWDFFPGPDGGLIQIFVYRSSDKRLVGIVANTQRAGADSSLQRGAGSYYLEVNSSGGWAVSIDDRR